MAGSPIAQVRRPNGLVLTLYRGPEHPFIHALNSTDAWAVCIDLPNGASTADAAASLDWDLVSGSGDTWVFAVNASLGLAVEVDPTQLAVRRSASIGTTAAAPIVLAKFGHGDVGPVGRRLVPSPDGKLLFAAGVRGLTVIKTADLSVVRTDLAGTSIDALGITPDGSTLFALLRDGGRIVAVDPQTGHPLGTVPGEGYDRLLAVAPW
jgi:DNA-binding beta-propeller fold protein YncE